MMDIKLALSLGLPIKLTAQQANGLCQQLINHEKRIAELEKELESSLYFNVDVIRCLSKIAWEHNHEYIPHYMNLAKQCIKSIELKNTPKEQSK